VESSLSGSRKGGWKNGHIYGAPFDATATLSVVHTSRHMIGDSRT
jgi:hypothetical protein